MNPRRLVRRVAFAAPLVLTIAAAPACSRSAAPTSVTPTNPPAPDPEPPTTAGEPGTWQQIDGRWQFRYDNGDVVFVDDAGGCHLQFDPNCGGGADPSVEAPTCNPPPPQDVACPPGQPSD